MGLYLDIFMLLLAISLYLLLRGFIKFPNPDVQKRTDALIKKNGFLLRLAAIAFVAVLLVNIVTRLKGGS